jgi:glucokinase
MTARAVPEERGPLVCAVDVGGTLIKAALTDAHGHAWHTATLPTHAADGSDAVIAAILAAVDELRAAARAEGVDAPDAVGVAVPGIVDEARGVAVFAANLPWRQLNVRDLIAAHTGLPVAFGHDVRTGALAEGLFGAARAFTDYLFLPIGTGVAGAVVIGGQVLAESGYAGEIGHVVVAPRGRRCGCGARGCLETVAAASAIARRYAVRAGRELDAAGVAKAALDGDRLAAQVWQEAVEALASALASYVSLLAPHAVVVGGGLGRAGDQLLDPLRAELAARLTFQPMPELLQARLGSMAGCLGAGLLAHRLRGRDPGPHGTAPAGGEPAPAPRPTHPAPA